MKKLIMKEDNAWKIYNFINEWKEGHFGIVPLQEALDKHLHLEEAEDDEKFIMAGSKPIPKYRKCRFFYSTGPDTYGCWRGVFPMDCQNCMNAEWSTVEIETTNSTDNLIIK